MVLKKTEEKIEFKIMNCVSQYSSKSESLEMTHTYIRTYECMYVCMCVCVRACVCVISSFVAQAVRQLPPSAGVPSLRLIHSTWVLWWKKRRLGRFFSRFLQFSPATNFIPPFLDTHLIHFVSFNFTRPCDDAPGVVGRHPFYSQSFNVGASTHLIPRSDTVSDMS